MTTPRPPESADDDRDPRVAEWLAVEPLDEVTRARLVQRSLAAASAATRARSTRRWLAVAAAALVGVLAVGTVVVTRSGDDTAPTASRSATDEKAERSETSTAAPSAAAAPTSDALEQRSSADASLADVVSLGNLGEVSTRAELRAALSGRRSEFGRPAVVAGPVPCRATVRDLGSITARATATVDGAPASVYVVERPDGRVRAVTVFDGTCTLGPAVTLNA